LDLAATCRERNDKPIKMDNKISKEELFSVIGDNQMEELVNPSAIFGGGLAPSCTGPSCKNSCTPGCSAGCASGCIQASGKDGFSIIPISGNEPIK
jgi:hypothetical protein